MARHEPRVGSIKRDKDILHIFPILVLEKTLEREREGEKPRFSLMIHRVSSVASRRA